MNKKQMMKRMIGLSLLAGLFLPIVANADSYTVKSGDTLSAIGSTNDINHTPRIIGITDEEYPAKVTGNPKNETGSPAVFNAAKLGCNNIPAIVIAKYALHLNFLAAEFASKNGKK